eukprot:159081_1
MASLLRSVFGGNSEAPEEKKDDSNNSNNNTNPSNQAPTETQLSKEQLANKQLAKLEAAMISQPATSESINSPPNKKRKIDSVDNDIGHLSEEMKLAMKLSMQNDINQDNKQAEQPQENNTNNNKNKNISKEHSYEYLMVMYILEIRHNNIFEYNKYIEIINDFKQFLNDNIISKYCIISDETPILSSTIEAILIDRFQKEFLIYKSSIKYLLKSYQRCIDFEIKINNYWTAIIPQTNQLQIIKNIQVCL